MIYVPYAVMIDGQIMQVFDPSLHTPIDMPTGTNEYFQWTSA